ncbi:MAG: hypothetical protein OEZ43_16855 [Gammaproteobacteria bacterium]|nr:hypothetical protein [Gammaproteobacteria bacterium]
MQGLLHKLALWSVLSFLALSSSAVMATDDKPFAEKKVVLQISDADPFKQTFVLNVANNLIQVFGPDKIDVEIVAFGPGLRLLFADNENKDRIDGLVNNGGVRFAACNNTLKSFAKQMGKEPALHNQAKIVSAGVIHILDLTAKGFTLVKP